MEWRIGTAGWTLPKQHAEHFAASSDGIGSEAARLSHLHRYAGRLGCAEINSSFHRPHMRRTWERWAASVPAGFRFAVKVPKAVTHTAKLVNTGGPLLEFLDQARGLGDKLGPLLVQLPPKLAYDEGVAHEFFTTLRELHDGAVVLEPRHASWFAPAVDQMLRGFEVARVAADPPKGSERAGRPGGWAGLRYWRLHGAPRTYYSEYGEAWLGEFAARLREDAAKADRPTWVVFDNTALGHATANAMWLERTLNADRSFAR